jgi:hypothetical protein
MDPTTIAALIAVVSTSVAGIVALISSSKTVDRIEATRLENTLEKLKIILDRAGIDENTEQKILDTFKDTNMFKDPSEVNKYIDQMQSVEK